MATETNKILEHEYDGIREYDNPLPGWWVWIFYGTIIFSVIHAPFYTLGFGLTSDQMYEEEVTLAAMTLQAPGAAGGPSSGAGGSQAIVASVEDLTGNSEAIAAGAAMFQVNCLPCHGDKGQGLIGPNLTDNHWLHGNSFQEIVTVISKGVPDKGMIPWKTVLNPRKIQEVAAFVVSLKGTTPPNPKAPQGKAYPD